MVPVLTCGGEGAERDDPGLAAGDESGAALPSCDRYVISGIFHYSYLSYKAESAGTELVKVDPRDTTQMCSNCGSIVKKTLSERVHECPYCGFVADRDYNAAVNIHRVGMEQPFEPVEPRPLHHISVVQVLSMKQEAPPERRGVVHASRQGAWTFSLLPPPQVLVRPGQVLGCQGAEE